MIEEACKYVGLPTDFIFDIVRYGGVAANACHGTGYDIQTVSDFIQEITLVNGEGEVLSITESGTLNEKG